MGLSAAFIFKPLASDRSKRYQLVPTEIHKTETRPARDRNAANVGILFTWRVRRYPFRFYFRTISFIMRADGGGGMGALRGRVERRPLHRLILYSGARRLTSLRARYFECCFHHLWIYLVSVTVHARCSRPHRSININDIVYIGHYSRKYKSSESSLVPFHGNF